ncbi:MAG: LysR family transcriptional regulator, partial [Deltaproteobacteria bacterium]|nr:LysR family transcriptional regulator [Deltaproteobacteria bacterium]
MSKFKGELDLHKLEVFYWVAELKSFSLAADHLSLRQPTVSAHIRELEESLGAKILSRERG